MEHRAKKLTVLAIGIVAVGIGCQPAWASRGGTTPAAEPQPEAPAPVVEKKPAESKEEKALATSEEQQLLDRVAKFLGEDPIDGRFGIGRVPALHGRTSHGSELQKDASGAWKKVTATNHAMIYTVGRGDTEDISDRKQPRVSTYAHGSTPNWWTEFRKLTPGQQKIALRRRSAETKKSMKAMSDAAQALMKSGLRRSSEPATFEGHKATIDYLAVYPTSEKCLSCHTGVPENEPIGVVSLVRIPKW